MTTYAAAISVNKPRPSPYSGFDFVLYPFLVDGNSPDEAYGRASRVARKLFPEENYKVFINWTCTNPVDPDGEVWIELMNK